jgi:hypothetical protein
MATPVPKPFKLQAALDLTSTPTHLPDAAFERCDGTRHILDGFGPALVSIDIPDSVTSFGNKCFSWCALLAAVNFGTGSQLTTISRTKPSLT